MRNKFIVKKAINIYKGTKRFLAHSYNTLSDKEKKVFILVYHRVLKEAYFNPLNNIVNLSTFARQVDGITKKYPVVTLSDIIQQCRCGEAKAQNQAVLTFDDGYSDNYEIALPILQKKGLTATFFLIADYINSNGPLWDWEIINVLRDYPEIKNIEITNGKIRQRPFEPRLSYILRILKEMKPLTSAERQAAISSLRVKTKESFGSDRCLTWEEAKKISHAGMEIGSHSLSHRSLGMISFSEAREEIKKSKEIIEDKIGAPCRYFSFPFGGKQDYNQMLIDYVKDAGYETCLLNVHGYNHIKKDSFSFRRIIMEEATNIKHLFG